MSKLVETGIKSTVAMVKASAEGKPTEQVVAEGALQVFAPALAHLIDKIQQWRHNFITHRLLRWWQKVGIDLGVHSPEELGQLFDQFSKDEWNQQTVFESMKALQDALDDAVVPAIGRLTARYAAHNKRPDRFFRGTARLLQDLSAEEYATLRTIVYNAMVRAKNLSKDCLIYLKYDEQKDVIVIWGRDPADDHQSIARRPIEKIHSGDRILYLLNVNGLSFDPNLIGSTMNNSAGITQETVSALWDIVKEETSEAEPE